MNRKELTSQVWMLSFERPAYKAGSWLASGNPDLGRVPTIPRTYKNCALFLNSLDKQYGLWWIFASLLEFWYTQAQAAWVTSPSQSPGHWISNECPRLATLVVVTTCCWENKVHLVCRYWEGTLAACSGFFWTWPQAPSPLLIVLVSFDWNKAWLCAKS